MGSSKKQIINSLVKEMTKTDRIEITDMEIDGERIDRLQMDGGEAGLMNTTVDWFFPLDVLTVSELKMVKTAMNKVKKSGL